MSDKLYALEFISKVVPGEGEDGAEMAARLKAVVYEDGVPRTLPGVVDGLLRMEQAGPVSGTVHVIERLAQPWLTELSIQFPEVTFVFIHPAEGYAPQVHARLEATGLTLEPLGTDVPDDLPVFDMACCPVPFRPNEGTAVQCVADSIVTYAQQLVAAANELHQGPDVTAFNLEHVHVILGAPKHPEANTVEPDLRIGITCYIPIPEGVMFIGLNGDEVVYRKH